MEATIKPMIEPDMDPRRTFVGINHLQEDEFIKLEIISSSATKETK